MANLTQKEENSIPYWKLNANEKKFLYYYCLTKMEKINQQTRYKKIKCFLAKNLCCGKQQIKFPKSKRLEPIIFELIERIVNSEPTVAYIFFHREKLLDKDRIRSYIDTIKQYGVDIYQIEEIANLLISLIKVYDGLFHRELAYPLHKAMFMKPNGKNIEFFLYYMRFAFTEDERKLFTELRRMFIYLSNNNSSIYRSLLIENVDMYFPECSYFTKSNVNTQAKLIDYFNDFNFHSVPEELLKKANDKLHTMILKKSRTIK
ncbi:hypothetical protein CWI37_0069p0040 [Hamiltosporidium tvaerminnensis]|uniref:Uncharacterized protein n=3 Tax=Hamiltosporidium TaxID=1176354 RepID=A0A4Q9LQ35_9MICR|nr:hypothetical protein CWI37_0069p0040 [Hamiltosporidium tvaerminnensis]TBU09480.1 hypothetical protein CWI39_0068p0050 [Hamiltosporidium magnivora]